MRFDAIGRTSADGLVYVARHVIQHTAIFENYGGHCCRDPGPGFDLCGPMQSDGAQRSSTTDLAYSTKYTSLSQEELALPLRLLGLG